MMIASRSANRLARSSLSSSLKSLGEPSKGIGGLRRSSTSLCLLNMSEESFQSTSKTSMESMVSLTPTDDASSTTILADETTSAAQMIQYLLFFCVAMQALPYFGKEVMEILDLHYHSVPLLIVLSAAFRRRNEPTVVSSGEASERATLKRSSRNSLPECCYPTTLQAASSASAVDDWGHFAELEDTLQDKDVHFFSSASNSTLSSLTETEDDE
jgi:hypothetical protein